MAKGFGFASAADFVIQSGITRFGGVADPERLITCRYRKNARRLRVPKGAKSWRFIDDAFGIVVTDVSVKDNGGPSCEIDSPGMLHDGDSIEVNLKNAPACAIC